MITGINESKTLTKHVSCKCKCKFDGRKCNSNQKWNRCYDLVMMSMNLRDVAILNIKSADYCCITSRISKSEAIKLMQNIDLIEKSRT